MRLRSRSHKHKALIWGLMALAGAVILLVSLPTWVLLALVGACLIGGAYLGYRSEIKGGGLGK